MIGPKLCGNCAFLQNFHTRKLGEITVFYAVQYILVEKINICQTIKRTMKFVIDNERKRFDSHEIDQRRLL